MRLLDLWKDLDWNAHLQNLKLDQQMSAIVETAVANTTSGN